MLFQQFIWFYTCAYRSVFKLFEHIFIIDIIILNFKDLEGKLPVIAFGGSDIGMKRKTNQDSICLLPEYHFYAVADGMGGHNGGDIASQMSVKLFPQYFAKHSQEVEVEQLLRDSVKHINRSIYDYGQKNIDLRGMGTTISCILLDEKHLNIANIGDSRVYLINQKKIYQLSKDHSLVQEKLNLGIYDREEARLDPQKNVLIRTVGFEKEVEVDTYKYKISKNDIFLICSDGLHGKVADADIINIINSKISDPGNATDEDLHAAVKSLIDQANLNGGQDNISVVLVLAK